MFNMEEPRTTRVASGYNVPSNLSKSDMVFTTRTCIDVCPEPGELEVSLAITAFDVFSQEQLQSASQTEPQNYTKTFPVRITIPASSWLSCWMNTLLTATGAIDYCILGSWFHRSVSFPKTKVNHPGLQRTPLALGSLHKPDYKPTILAIDSYALKRTWYRHESVYINDDTMMLSKEEKIILPGSPS